MLSTLLFARKDTVNRRSTVNVKLQLSKKLLLLVLGLIVLFIPKAMAQPSNPTGLYVVALDGANELHWNKSAGATNYLIYRSVDSITFTNVATVAASDTSYTDNGLVNRRFYFYRVTATDGTESGPSNVDASIPQKMLAKYTSFDGNDYFRVNDGGNMDFGPNTSVEFWARFNDISNNPVVLDRFDESTGTQIYFIGIRSGNLFFTNALWGFEETRLKSTTNIQPGTWYHVAITYDYTIKSFSLYINGIEEATYTSAIMSYEYIYTTENLYIGVKKNSSTDYKRHLNGQLAELRLWNKTLDAAEINANKDIPFLGTDTNLLALYHFNGIKNGVTYCSSPVIYNAESVDDPFSPDLDLAGVNDTVKYLEDSNNNNLVNKSNDTMDYGDYVKTEIIEGPNFGTAQVLSNNSINYTPDADYFGYDTIKYLIVDSVLLGDPYVFSDTAFVYITVDPINDPPSFSHIGNQTVNEDATKDTVSGWAYNISKGPANESSQDLTFYVTNNNNDLFSAQPEISPTGDLIFAPAADSNGVATVDVVLKDNGGTSNSGVDSTIHYTFTITVNAVNDAPSFKHNGNQTVNEDDTTVTVLGWAYDISKGPANESSQIVNFTLTSNNTSLFSQQPSINSSGDLTFTPAANAYGTATVNVVLQDNGGTANNGVDTVSQTFEITINPINDPPSFSHLGDQTVNEDTTTVTVLGWAYNISKGAANESSQNLTFYVTNNNNDLFSAQPEISPAGDLIFTPAADSNGVATVDVVLKDNGDTLNNGVDSTIHYTFTITVTAVNDAATDITLDNNRIDEALPAGTFVGEFSSIDKEQADTHLYELVSGVGDVDNSKFRIVGGELRTDAILRFEQQAVYSIRVRSTDNGAPKLSIEKEFTIYLNKVNSAPSAISLSPNSIDENLAGGTTVGDLSTTDPDTVNEHSYAILEGYDGALFTINGHALVALKSFNYELRNTYQVSILTDDNSGETYDSVLTININNVNEAPVFIDTEDRPIERQEFTLEAYDTISVCPIVMDVEGDSTFYVHMESNNGHGVLISDVNDPACLQFIPDSSYRGQEQVLLVTADAGTPMLTDTLLLTFNITEPYINHSPVIVDESDNSIDTLYYVIFANEPIELCLNAYDPDDDLLRLSGTSIFEGNAEVINLDEDGLCFEVLPGEDFIGQVYLYAVVEDNGIPVLNDTVVISLWVEPKLEFSQAISPNNDAINDYLLITGIEKFPDNKIDIFNRHEDVLYTKKSYDNLNEVWEGQSNISSYGSTLTPDGTYFYVLEIKGYPKLIKGFVVLKRKK